MRSPRVESTAVFDWFSQLRYIDPVEERFDTNACRVGQIAGELVHRVAKFGSCPDTFDHTDDKQLSAERSSDRIRGDRVEEGRISVDTSDAGTSRRSHGLSRATIVRDGPA